jgi:N-acetylneuraminic acid mutarotase
MKQWLPVVLGVILAACGGGGSGGGGNSGGGGTTGGGTGGGDNNGWLDIREPIIGNGTYVTRAPSIEISGTAFVSPADVDCVSVNPVQLKLNWHNSSTGQNDDGGISSRCQNTFLGLQWISRWVIAEGSIDLQIGDNIIDIEATDNAGNRGTATINVIREDDVTAPVIVSRSPAADAVDVPANRSITVIFNESMLPGSLSGQHFTLADPTGLEVQAFLDYDDRNFRWQLTPTADLLYSTVYTATVSGLVEDEFGGNTMGADVRWSFTTAPNPDVTPPEVGALSPDPDSVCVAPGSNVLARFNEPLNSSTINAATFVLTEAGGTSIDASVSYDGVTARLEPLLPLLAGTDYEAMLTAGITDLAGNALVADFRWTYTTAASSVVGTWNQTSLSGAPFERRDHTVIWDGSEIIFWGGHGWDRSIGAFVDTNTGGRYDPATDSWGAMNSDGAPTLSEHSAVFTGSEMIVWGGNTNIGARYEPGTDAWQPMTSTGVPAPRRKHAAVWTGSEMIVWGGEGTSGVTIDSGGRYNPATDTWAPMSTAGAPSPRRDMAFAWTGSEFIVWGGISVSSGGEALNDGARYDPATDTWQRLPVSDASGGADAMAAWTGTEMITWDGGLPSLIGSDGFPTKTPTLRLYDPVTDSWRATSSLCEPYLGAGEMHAHWTGSRLFVWNNNSDNGYFYDPASDSWAAIDSLGGPPARGGAASAWTGDRFILWGGQEAGGLQDTGFVFGE